MFFVCLEGVDAAGKSTVAKKVADWFRARKRPPKVLHELSFPAYDSTTGRAIKAHLSKEWAAHALLDGDGDLPGQRSLDALVFQCLQTANRFETLPDEMFHDYADYVVIADRFDLSAIVYGGIDGLDKRLLMNLQRGLPVPDLYILLDIPVAESVKRRPERRDRYEADLPFLEKVRAKYLEVFGHDVEGCVIVDASQHPSAVLANVLEHVERAYAACENP